MGNRTTLIAFLVPLTAFCGVTRAADEAYSALQGEFGKTIQPFVQTYCISCHGKEKPEAEMDLSKFSTIESVAADTRRWNLILERVRAEEMPPAEANAKPSAEERKHAIEWIQSFADYQTKKSAGDPGIVLTRRLSNAEYDYTIRDLTGVDIHPTKEFPVDPANEAGFDNSGESLAMSPALVKKYLDAARQVSEYVLFKPHGFTFAPFPVVTDEDRDNYVVHRVVDFYKKQKLDYANFFQAAWRYKNRAALGKPAVTLEELANEAGISPKYLNTIWSTLNQPGETGGPIAVIQGRFNKLPTPENGQEPAAVRSECERMREFIVDLRPFVRKEFDNLPAQQIAAGSQTLMLWKDRQYAENRLTYAGNALQLDMSAYKDKEPLMIPPTGEAERKEYDQAFTRFCAVFPDVFYVSERARMYLTNPQEIQSDFRGHRLLTAGFHSQMGYFRDDMPLYKLILTQPQQQELDQLWKELDFIADVPARMHKQFLWYERAESRFMLDREFDLFRPEGDDTTSEAKIFQLAELYIIKARRVGNSEATIKVLQEHFDIVNANIRAVEKARAEAEPTHLDSLLSFAERAYRRPLLQSEKDGILAFYRQLRDQKLGHEEAVRDSVVSVLMSPYFCYRIDSPAKTVDKGIHPLTDYELASRLSYFLWSSLPDQELLSHAAAGDLHQESVLLAQTRRMMQDQRINGFAKEFAGNWLDIRRFEEHNAVDREKFPSFTNELREAMFQEPIHFVQDLVQRNGSILDLIYGDYTFVNPVLAKHYGMPDMEEAGKETWVRIDNASRYQRGGVLPMSGFLTKNAPGLRTSPVKRGYWVVTKLLGEHIPAPPPNVPVLPTDETKLGDLTLRQTLERHRADKACASCHDKFDAFGLVFEGFGPIGEARENDLAGRPVQIGAVFPDGTEGSGLPGLKSYFKTKVEGEFVDNLCRKLMVYALGRGLLASDELVVDEMRQKLKSDGYRFNNLVETIVTSKQFLTKRGAPEATKE